MVSPWPASLAPRIRRLPKRPTHLSTHSGSPVSWGPDKLCVHIACRRRRVRGARWSALARCSPPKDISYGGFCRVAALRRPQMVSASRQLRTFDHAMVSGLAPGAKGLAALVPGRLAGASVGRNGTWTECRGTTFCQHLSSLSSPRPPLCQGALPLPPYRTKGRCLWNMESKIPVHSSLLRHALSVKEGQGQGCQAEWPQVTMLEKT